jgi:DNA-binding GntR family transcriptional regulator
MAQPDPSAMSLPKVSHTPMADQAYEAIRDSIAHRRFPPGAQLVEARLADELGISRGPVREGLKRLRQEGLVVHHPHQGMFVRELTAADVTHIYDVRIALESVAIRQLARRGTAPPEFQALVERMQSAARANRIRDLISLGYEFHRVLCASSGNPLLVEFFDLMSIQARLALEFDSIEYLRHQDPQDFVDAHAALVTVIEEGDEQRAAAALESHVLDGIGLLVDRLAQEGLRNGDDATIAVGARPVAGS